LFAIGRTKLAREMGKSMSRSKRNKKRANKEQEEEHREDEHKQDEKESSESVDEFTSFIKRTTNDLLYIMTTQ